MDARDWIEFGVDQTGEIVSWFRPQANIARPAPGGGVLVGQSYYPPFVSNAQTQLVVIGGAVLLALLLLRK